MMKVIGIVGGMGAGKTTVVSLIKKYKKTFIISADEIGHTLLLKGNRAYELVVQAFGSAILSEDGEILRKKLGELVFQDSKKLQILNAITHPLIYEEVAAQIKQCEKEGWFELIIIDAALLIEIGLIRLTNLVIAVYASEEIRVKRVMKRQPLTKEQVQERFKAQKKWEEFTHIADEWIDNSLSLEETEKQIKNLINHW